MSREIVAGITTFLTMSYIVVVNPAILSTPGTGMPFSGVLTATVLVCFTMTLLMGVYAKLPYGVAPGMGLNAATGEYEDLVKAGVIDPVKVTRSALRNAASIASMVLTTDTLVVEKKVDEEPAAGGGHGHSH